MSARVRPALFLVLALVAGWARADQPRQSAASRIASDVARLASDEWEGRRAGMPGANAAALWLAAEFHRIGLRPAGEGGYFQGFSFIDGVHLGPRNRLVVPETSGDGLAPGEDFVPLALSAPGVASGEVVFAGYGIVARELGRDDYAGLDVRDKIVLLLRFGPGGDLPQSKWASYAHLRLKASEARDRGALAVLVVTGPLGKDAQDSLVPLRADASLADGGLPALSIRQAVAESMLACVGRTLREAQRAADEGPASFALRGVRVELVADLSPRRSTTRNVVGLLPGRIADADPVLVGAHYDHLGRGSAGSLDPRSEGQIHPGADDNASGVAALLEVARALAPRAATLARGVLFVAFGAEELGTLGSSHFVKNPPPSASRIAAMVNLDMVGRLRGDVVDVHGVGTSPLWKEILEVSRKGSGLELRMHETAFGLSDHAPFYAAGKPILFFFTGLHPDYHRPEDTADRIDARGIARIASLVGAVVEKVAALEGAPAFVRVGADDDPPGGSADPRVWVGAIPDFSEEGPGLGFSGTSPGSPAEMAGIRRGDILVRFGEKSIRSLFDYTTALRGRKPGEEVAIVVRRDGRDVALELILGTRPVRGER